MKDFKLQCPDCGIVLCPDLSDYGVEHRHPTAEDVNESELPGLHAMYLLCSNAGKTLRRAIGELEIV